MRSLSTGRQAIRKSPRAEISKVLACGALSGIGVADQAKIEPTSSDLLPSSGPQQGKKRA
jgi:hypothetical protein